MGRSLEQVIDSLPADRRARVEARAAELIAEEMTLRELRKAAGRSQSEVAAAVGTAQESVSRLERRDDVLLSSIEGYVRALGGEMQLLISLPGRPPVRLRTRDAAEAITAPD